MAGTAGREDCPLDALEKFSVDPVGAEIDLLMSQSMPKMIPKAKILQKNTDSSAVFTHIHQGGVILIINMLRVARGSRYNS